MLQFCWNQTNQSAKFPINSVILLSLPVWECGLKSWYASIACCSQTSLPVWECGLKFTIGQEQPTVLASLPVWECGLKYHICLSCRSVRYVTPRVVVWIEIEKTAA